MTVDLAAGAAVAIQETDVLWINAGLSCDGDTIAVTAATQTSIADLVLGSLPRNPKVNFHNLFLAYENGDDFLEHLHRETGVWGPGRNATLANEVGCRASVDAPMGGNLHRTHHARFLG